MARTPAVEVYARNPAVRAGLRELLTHAGIEVIDGASASPPSDGSQLSDIDVLLLDAPGDLEASVRSLALAAESGGVPAIFLVDRLPLEATSTQPSRQAAPRGWLRRDATEEELAAAVRAVAAGLQVIDPALEIQTHDHGAATTLTEREREVLALIAIGLTNRAIALELGISEHTAKFHVGAVLAKLEAQSRAEAVSVAVRGGLLTL
ncbi:MAG: response regulator transcription factor [Dehalococcoidia bacterium]|nr:response regulator transcription factor [Dehalococcoidia bacterium]